MLRDERSYIEPVVQLDSVDLNRHVRGNNDLLTTGLGFVLSPLPHYLLKFEYDVVKERHGLPLKNNSLFAAVVVEF
jgi:hypothetical protein